MQLAMDLRFYIDVFNFLAHTCGSEFSLFYLFLDTDTPKIYYVPHYSELERLRQHIYDSWLPSSPS